MYLVGPRWCRNMATQVRAGQLFRYRSFHINKTQPLGHGSYGAVYKAKCDQLTCAAKVLHPTILDPLDPGAGKIMDRFRQECAFLESIRHPNIVQYLGMTRDPESGHPVLLMELLDESLTKMLERSPTALPYFVEVDICHDIALAVAYLHSNDIIHRDLSSNNVLIMAKRRAKVTDFGMSRISSAAPTMTPLTMCPGTHVYMSPEALEEPPTYTKKLDCFSEGVMMIQVCTRLWPKPGPRTKPVQDSRSPTGRIQIPVLETERRQNHINKIDRGHSLLPIAMDCLRYQESERPTSEALCERLAGLKETREYRESTEQVEREQNDIAELERQIGEIQAREEATIQQLRDENQQLLGEVQSKAELLQTAERQNQLLSSQNERLRQQLEEQGRELQLRVKPLNRQLEEPDLEQVTAEIQHCIQRRVKQLKTKPSPPPPSVAPKGAKLQEHQPGKVKQSQPSPRQDQLKRTYPQVMLRKWKDGEKAPIEMKRGAAVVVENVAYFMNWDGQNYSYGKGWSKLLRCPYDNSSLAVIGGLLTAIGGQMLWVGPQKKLLSLVDKKWMETFPPMPTKRSHTAAVTTQHHLVVVGGEDGSRRHIDTVEVMDTEARVWSTAASLPHPYSSASATICGDQLYLLGGTDSFGRTKSVLTCSLTSLLQSQSETSSLSVWKRISDAPMYHSTCAAIDGSGELLAVGGQDEQHGTTSAVYKYDSTTASWILIGNMPNGRYNSLVAVLPTNEMVVVGGNAGWRLTNKVTIASIYMDYR